MKTLFAFALASMLSAGAGHTTTLSVGSLGGVVGGPTVTLPEATLTSSDAFYFGGASTVPGSFCALDASAYNCEADLTISFVSPVTNLMFQVSGWHTGDFVQLSIFDTLNNLLGIVGIGSDFAVLDLSSYGSIGSLFFDDSSTGAGVAYSDFSFDQGASPIPLPAAGWLMLAGLGALAAARRTRR